MRRIGTVVAAGLVLGVAACTGGTPPQPPDGGGDPGRPLAAPYRLVSFSSCGDLVRDLKDAAKESVGPYGFWNGNYAVPAAGGVVEDRAAAPAAPTAQAPEHSTTNTHEAGVDEPDAVKTDGRRIVTVSQGVLRVVDAASHRVTGTLALTKDLQVYGEPDLLLAGDRVLIVSNGYLAGRGGPMPTDRVGPYYGGARLIQVDLAGGTPKVAGTLSLDGRYVDARMVGSTVRVVVSSTPRLDFPYDAKVRTDAERIAANRQVIERAPVDAWLPRYTLVRDGRTMGGRVDCGSVSTPASYSGSALLTVLTLDLAGPLGTGDPVTLAADGDTVYATAGSLYVANDQRWQYPVTSAKTAREGRTELYQFDISGAGKPRFVASGAVSGWLLNQYAMSEYAGRLRVATTAGAPWSTGTQTQSAVSVLTRQGETLGVTGTVGGLGKGERIYSVRFVGPVGYVVTFRQTDPLYAVDLRDPAHPRVTGELKITGYSSYLHPLDGDRLIGIGQEASGAGRTQGTQVSLFDVSDPAAPSRTAQYHLASAYSEAEYDPHAFLYWPATGTLVVPISIYQGAGTTNGALVLRVRDGSLTEVGTVRPVQSREWNGVRRSLVVGGTLWTLTADGLQANDLGTLAQQAWIPLGG
jgi:uncharacterized secreted protein with C-terminal beta-propeller domain